MHRKFGLLSLGKASGHCAHCIWNLMFEYFDWLIGCYITYFCIICEAHRAQWVDALYKSPVLLLFLLFKFQCSNHWATPPHLEAHCGILPLLTYRLLWVSFKALAATPMTLRTSVLVEAFSSASRWNSMVERVPSICWSCFSYRFLRFRACRAAGNKESNFRQCMSSQYRLQPTTARAALHCQHLQCIILVLFHP